MYHEPEPVCEVIQDVYVSPKPREEKVTTFIPESEMIAWRSSARFMFTINCVLSLALGGAIAGLLKLLFQRSL